MADCSYVRCQQERRLIKKKLLKWSTDMLHIVVDIPAQTQRQQHHFQWFPPATFATH
uniref:HDC14913 n=1 Tax=Drosophila melanogaster TaxID=7227 RepID=Q6IJH3_DROME|nr:TPA_inf: HDC14913 [Drosophila melanogaster]